MANSQSERLLTNSLYNLSIFVNQLLMAVVLVPFIVRHLGDSTYGIWALVSAVLSYSNLMTLSLNSGVTRWIPMLLVKGDLAGVNRVVATVMLAFGASAVVLAVAVAVLVAVFPIVFAVPAELAAASQVSTALVGVGFICLVQLSVFTGVLGGLERYDLVAACEFTRASIQIAGVIAVLVGGGGLIALGAVYSLANIARSVVSVLLAKRALPELRVRLRDGSFTLFREMLGYSVNSFLYTVQDAFARQMGLVLIGATLTTAAVTEYAMPTVLSSVLVLLVAQLTNVMKPAVSRLDASDADATVRTMYLGSSKFALMLGIPIGTALFVFGDRFLILWLAEAYVPAEARILSVMAVATVFRAWLRPAFFVVVGVGRHKVFGRVAMAQVLFAIGVAQLGLSLWGWGTLEVAVAFAVPEVVVALLVLVPHSSRVVGVSLRRLLREAVLPAVVANVPVVVAVLALESSLRQLDGLLFLGALAAVGALAPAGAWLLGLTQDEKRMLLGAARLR